jgi:putative spermidine/putrescine transport system permease protein
MTMTTTTPTTEQRSTTRRRGRGHKALPPLLAWPALIWISVAVIVPVAFVVVVGFWRLDGFQLARAWDPATYTAMLSDRTFWGIVWWTVRTWATVLGLILLIGVPAAYFIARHVRSLSMQTTILMLTVLPFWVSYVIRIITWIPMFGNKGVLNWALVKSGILDSPSSAFLYNPVAMTIALVAMYIVFIVGPVYFGLSRIDADTLAASRMSGASPWTTFWKVELPLAKPGIIAGSFFATVFLLGDFATEQIVGGAQNPMLAGLSLRYAETLQWPMAAAVSAALLAIALVLIWLLSRVHDLRKEV